MQLRLASIVDHVTFHGRTHVGGLESMRHWRHARPVNKLDTVDLHPYLADKKCIDKLYQKDKLARL